MTRKIILGLAALLLLVAAGARSAEEGKAVDKKRVVALKTDDFELQETDISHLGIGDAETVVTDSGKTIDLLRTADGLEVYVDGELLEPGLHDDGAVDVHHGMIHKRVEVYCDDDEACEEKVWISDSDDIDPDALDGDGHKVIMIHEAPAEGDENPHLQHGEHEEKVIVIRKRMETD